MKLIFKTNGFEYNQYNGIAVEYDGNKRPDKSELVTVTFPDGETAYVGGDELFPYKKKRWKMPSNGHFSDYCCHCRHWTWEKTLGCAYIGRCDVIKREPTEQDAYDPLCVLFEK